MSRVDPMLYNTKGVSCSERTIQMPLPFERDGIALQYPDHWKLDQEESEDGWSALFESQETAFLMISLHPDVDDPSQLAEGVLDALREEYPELEADTAVESVAGQPAIGHDISFVALDLTSTARTRCLTATQGCILVMVQLCDSELVRHDPVLRAMQTSLTITE